MDQRDLDPELLELARWLWPDLYPVDGRLDELQARLLQVRLARPLTDQEAHRLLADRGLVEVVDDLEVVVGKLRAAHALLDELDLWPGVEPVPCRLGCLCGALPGEDHDPSCQEPLRDRALDLVADAIGTLEALAGG